MDTSIRLSKTTIILHWVVALSLIGQTFIGLYMTYLQKWPYYPIHKSVGVLLVAIILLRVLWRAKNGWPQPVAKYSNLEVLLAKSSHWILLLSTMLMPIWGMMFSAASGHGFNLFDLVIVPGNPDPQNPGEVIARSQFWSDFGQSAHRYNGYLFVAVLGLHILGALKHHFVDKDATLRRMLGMQKSISQ